MHTYASAFTGLSKALQPLYDNREAAAIAHEVMEHITGTTRLQRITEKDKELTPDEQAEYERIKPLLLAGTPLQYVTGKCWFMGREFMVDSAVLIPRPETEELVQWVTDDYTGRNISILDIGTGSGCIPVSLKLAMPGAEVSAIDVSKDALAVANANARALGADVQFSEFDFLNTEQWDLLDSYDIIVSNPPYIPVKEKETLHQNVRGYEPGLALFVPDDDALLFYRLIAEFASTHLNEGGAVYCELHVDYAEQTELLYKANGYTTELRKDMHGNLRMLKAQK